MGQLNISILIALFISGGQKLISRKSKNLESSVDVCYEINLPTYPLNHIGFMLSGGLMFNICGFFASFKYGRHACELQDNKLEKK